MYPDPWKIRDSGNTVLTATQKNHMEDNVFLLDLWEVMNIKHTFKYVDGKLILNHKGCITDDCIREYNDSWNRCYRWLAYYIENADVEKFRADFQIVRERQERALKFTARKNTRLIKAHENRLAVYVMYGRGYNITGTYSSLMKKYYRAYAPCLAQGTMCFGMSPGMAAL